MRRRGTAIFCRESPCGEHGKQHARCKQAVHELGEKLLCTRDAAALGRETQTRWSALEADMQCAGRTCMGGWARIHHAPECLGRPDGLPQQHDDAKGQAADDSQAQVVDTHDGDGDEGQCAEDDQPQRIHNVLNSPCQAHLPFSQCRRQVKVMRSGRARMLSLHVGVTRISPAPACAALS